jgi:hypothetical protein
VDNEGSEVKKKQHFHWQKDSQILTAPCGIPKILEQPALAWRLRQGGEH